MTVLLSMFTTYRDSHISNNECSFYISTLHHTYSTNAQIFNAGRGKGCFMILMLNDAPITCSSILAGTLYEANRMILLMTIRMFMNLDKTFFFFSVLQITFFRGVKPETALQNKGVLQDLLQTLRSLCLRRQSQAPSPPKLDCCLFSYRTPAGVNFHIFDTVLVWGNARLSLQPARRGKMKPLQHWLVAENVR